MNKPSLHATVLEELRARFRLLLGAAAETRRGATDPENRSEGKYDTRSIEANYLADGQGRQAEKLAHAIAAIEQLEPRPWAADEPISSGAAVEVELRGARLWFFLVPAGGGQEVKFDGREMTLLTPESPLGRQLVGARSGHRTKDPDATVLRVL